MVQPKPSALTEILSTTTVEHFDYELVDGKHRDRVLKIAAEVRERVRTVGRAVIEVGQRLQEVKVLLPHGRWGAWLKGEFGWSERTAQRYMRAAEVFGSKSDIVSDLPATVIHALAAPSTPEEVREEVVREVAEQTAVPSVASVKRRGTLARASGQSVALTECRQRASTASAALMESQTERAEAAAALIVKELGEERFTQIAEKVKGLPATIVGAALLKAAGSSRRGLISELNLD